MKRSKKNLDYNEKRRGRSLDATGAGPFIQLGIALFALVVVVLAVIFLILPLVRGTVDWNAVFVKHTPPPAAVADETPAVPALISSRVQTLRLDVKNGAAVLADASIANGELVYASGMTEESLDRIVRCDLKTGKSHTVTPALTNDSLRYPRANDDFLVWFDAKNGGGGDICVRRASGGEDVALVQLDTGLPMLYLSGRYLLFKTDAGIAAKLYVVDLESFEALTLALLAGEEAASAPDIEGGRVCFTAKDGLRVLDLGEGSDTFIETESFVHDPRIMGEGLLWLTGAHGEDTDLYYRAADGRTFILARGVVDARAAANCAVYGRDGTVYAYSLPTERFYMLSGAQEYAELIDARGDYALWRVLAEDAVYYRYLKVN